ncbi:MAG: DUF5711 family protein [Clostridia bacterium]|nr:DUF5711 family protein [Clostridia bacterium]
MSKREMLKIALSVIALTVLIAVSAVQISMQRASEAPQTLDGSMYGTEDDNGLETATIKRFGDAVALASSTAFVAVNENGEKIIDEPISINTPLLHSNGDYMALADEGGSGVWIYHGRDMCAHITTEEDIVGVRVNRSGTFAVATKKAGYKAEITVYKEDGTSLFRYLCGEASFVDMDLSPDGSRLLLSSLKTDSTYSASLLLIPVHGGETSIVTLVEGEIFIGVRYNRDGSFLALGTARLDRYNADGSLKWTRDFSGKTLCDACLDDQDNIALAFETNATSLLSGGANVEIYNRNGVLTGTYSAPGNIRSITLCDNGIAVTYGKIVDIISSRGELKKSAEANTNIRSAAVFKSGRHVLIFGGGRAEILDI